MSRKDRVGTTDDVAPLPTGNADTLSFDASIFVPDTFARDASSSFADSGFASPAVLNYQDELNQAARG